MRKYRVAAAGGVAFGVLMLWVLCLPRDLFRGVPYSTVVVDRQGELLGARIADDGQWRFPPCDSVPEKFAIALLQFEDRRFYRHPGVSPHAMVRAVVQNIIEGRTVSGASTITMQLARMSRRKPRNLWQKCVEMLLATRIEARYTKDEILCLYASHAPFGGNVVGIDAAIWRYFGNDGSDLSWAEAATLAVLQNSPSLIHPGRNRNALLDKRNRLLRRLADVGYLSEFDYELSLDEPLIDKPLPLPCHAPHLVAWHDAVDHGRKTVTAIDLSLQQQITDITDRWARELRTIGVNDLAAVVMDVATGEIIAYCGNADIERDRPGVQVDIARSPRSSGSILKPLLYCAALQEGEILPDALLPDVPSHFSGFSPQNFDSQFIGAVAASDALSRSLNVSNVHLLRDFGVMRFVEMLRKAGLTTLTRHADDYGLSLILGGGEVTLAEITALYTRLAACYQTGEEFVLSDKMALWYTFEALRRVDRPDELDWHRVSSVQNIAWKTGTSYGSRDAWAVGVTPRYAVGVWAGNAEGQASPDLTGARTAGPVMFDIFNLLPASEWFTAPDGQDGVYAEVCMHSGFLAGRDCTDTISMLLPRNALRSPVCPYHRSVVVSLDEKYRIEDRSELTKVVKMFVLPPAMEWYYKQHHAEYVSLPPLKAGSMTGGQYETMRFIYPSQGSVVSIPRQMGGDLRGVTFTLAHNDPSKDIFWHLDDEYLGSTRDIHKMQIHTSSGHHAVTVVDSDGSSLTIEFEVV